MEKRRIRLGDVVDDYCQRCRLIMNHGVVGMIGDEVRKVRCNTCMSEHLYRHGRLPKKRRDERGRLFDEVLQGLGRKRSEEEMDEDREASPGADEEAAGAPDVTAAPTEADEGAAEDAAPADAGDQPAGTADAKEAPDAARDAAREQEAAHGVRRKLYTIRRHSGGKAPGSGNPKG